MRQLNAQVKCWINGLLIIQFKTPFSTRVRIQSLSRSLLTMEFLRDWIPRMSCHDSLAIYSHEFKRLEETENLEKKLKRVLISHNLSKLDIQSHMNNKFEDNLLCLHMSLRHLQGNKHDSETYLKSFSQGFAEVFLRVLGPFSEVESHCSPQKI